MAKIALINSALFNGDKVSRPIILRIGNPIVITNNVNIHYVDETKQIHLDDKCRDVAKDKRKQQTNSSISQTNEQGVNCSFPANRLRFLIADEFSDFEKEVENNVDVDHVDPEGNVS